MTLVWDASTDPTAAGYSVYYGVGSRAYTNMLNAGSATSITIPGLVAGVTYYFAATTYNALGLESDYSAETAYTVPQSANLPPTLQQPANVTINENSGAQTITLTGISSGSPNENQALSVTALSSNPSLTGTPAVQYTSPNTTAQLTFSPAANSYGSASITVMVDDGGSISNTILRAFSVTVLAVNNPPTLDALDSLTIDENAGPQTITLSGITAGAGESGDLSVTVTSSNPGLIPNPTVQYTSPSATGTVLCAPVTNTYGWSRLTVTVNDGQPTNNLFSQSFVVTVRPSDPGSTNGTPGAGWTLWWQRTDGLTALWRMDGTNRVSGALLNVQPVHSSWRLAGQGDFNGDGQTDLLWQNTDGTVGIWLMNETNCIGHARVPNTPAGTAWRIGGVGDLNGDGIPDIIWHHTSGIASVWFMDGTNYTRKSRLNAPLAGKNWRIAVAADFNHDQHTDLLWQYPGGDTAVWLMNGTNCISHFPLSIPATGEGWRIVGVADLDAAGHSNVLWQNDTTGELAYWLMDGTTRLGAGHLNPSRVDPSWRAMGPR